MRLGMGHIPSYYLEMDLRVQLLGHKVLLLLGILGHLLEDTVLEQVGTVLGGIEEGNLVGLEGKLLVGADILQDLEGKLGYHQDMVVLQVGKLGYHHELGIQQVGLHNHLEPQGILAELLGILAEPQGSHGPCRAFPSFPFFHA